jgi:hypothetical protein
VGAGAARSLLPSTGKREEEILAPRDVHLLKPVQRRPEGFVSLISERKRDVVVKDFGLGVPPLEPQEVVGRHPFGTCVGGMLQAEQWAFVVAVPQRPTGDLVERDRVAEPTWPIWLSGQLPGEQHPAVGDHHRSMVRNDPLPGFELSAQECLPLRPPPVSPPGDVRLCLVRTHRRGA